jgi:hypothetical protein
MSEWSERIAGKIDNKAEKKATVNAKVIEKQEIIAQQGPALWDQVRAAVKKNCEDLNRDVKEQVTAVEVTPQSEIRVRANSGASTFWFQANFDLENGLVWNSNTRMASGGHYRLDIDPNDGKAHFYENSWIPSSPDSIARTMIGSLFD